MLVLVVSGCVLVELLGGSIRLIVFITKPSLVGVLVVDTEQAVQRQIMNELAGRRSNELMVNTLQVKYEYVVDVNEYRVNNHLWEEAREDFEFDVVCFSRHKY